jgi:hypothetical protein
LPVPQHNLLLRFEKHLEKIEGLRDEVETKEQAGRIKFALTRATQQTRRFIR